MEILVGLASLVVALVMLVLLVGLVIQEPVALVGFVPFVWLGWRVRRWWRRSTGR